MKDNALGQKIRNYRIASGKSQFELEEAINAAHGSLSRIENGEVNPTKETIFAIIETLQLDIDQSADLFEIDLSENYKKLQKIYEEFPDDIDLDKFISFVTHELTVKMGGVYSSLWLWDENSYSLNLKTFSASNKTMNFVLNVLKLDISKVHFTQVNPEHIDNLILKTFLDNKISFTKNFYDIGKPYSGIHTSKVISKFLGMRLAIHMPIRFKDSILGVIGWIWPDIDISDSKLNELTFIVDQVGREIFYIKKINELQRSLRQD